MFEKERVLSQIFYRWDNMRNFLTWYVRSEGFLLYSIELLYLGLDVIKANRLFGTLGDGVLLIFKISMDLHIVYSIGDLP